MQAIFLGTMHRQETGLFGLRCCLCLIQIDFKNFCDTCSFGIKNGRSESNGSLLVWLDGPGDLSCPAVDCHPVNPGFLKREGGCLAIRMIA